MKFIYFIFVLSFSCLIGSPKAIYLTLPEDPSHSMSIHWIEKLKEDSFKGVSYRKEGESIWKEVGFASNQIFGKSSFRVKQSVLTGLEANLGYYFRLMGDEEEHYFRTLPSTLDRELKIAVGGDLYNALGPYTKMNRVVAKKSPDFAILGGDIAYTGGGKPTRWITFLEEWYKTMRGDKGRLIPFLAILGNHDVSSLDRKNKGKNTLFFQLFPFPANRSYQTRDIVKELSFFLLDSDHIHSIAGEQAVWLEEVLKQRKDVLWKIPIYHIAAYPSIYSFSDDRSTRIRTHWIPLFEKYGVRLAFEHHNHAFKRTKPLLAGKEDRSGIVYIGDGAWGVSPRGSFKNTSYFVSYKKTNCVSLLIVRAQSLKVETFDLESNLIDEWGLQKDPI